MNHTWFSTHNRYQKNQRLIKFVSLDTFVTSSLSQSNHFVISSSLLKVAVRKPFLRKGNKKKRSVATGVTNPHLKFFSVEIIIISVCRGDQGRGKTGSVQSISKTWQSVCHGLGLQFSSSGVRDLMGTDEILNTKIQSQTSNTLPAQSKDT